MADSKISALPLDTTLTGAEHVPVVDGGANKKTTAQAIANLKDVSNLVVKETGKGLSANDYTNADKAKVTAIDQVYTGTEKTKLASLNQHYKGSYISLSALQTAVPSAVAGDYALVDTASGDAQQYIWDATNSTWVTSGVTGTVADWNTLLNKPSTFTPAAHTQAISTITGLQTALDSKVDDADLVTSMAQIDAEKLGLELAATYADITASTSPRFVRVATDENNNGDKSLYLHYGTGIDFIQTIL